MKNASPEFDAYIAAAPDYARPVLKKLRTLMHKACPQIQEEMKWSQPMFVHQGIVAGMGAFKEHIRFAFWRGKLMGDKHGIFGDSQGGQAVMKLRAISDLPSDKILLDVIKQAIALHDAGVKVARPKKTGPRAELKVPDYLTKALKKNKRALATFEGFSYSKRNDYIEWLVEAKQEATREKRLATAIEWMTEGKARNWKYQ